MTPENQSSPENLSSQDPSNDSSFRSKFLSFKKPTVISIMIILSIILLVPIALFIISSLRSEPPPKQTNLPQTNKIDELFEAPYVEGELITKYKDKYTFDEIMRLKSKLEEIGVVRQEKAYEGEEGYLRNYYLLKFKPGTDLKKVAKQLSDFKEIESFHPNYIGEADEVPSDSLYPQLWGLEKIDMPNTWSITHGSNNIKIAVIDTGIDYTHQDFQGRNIIKGTDFSTCNAFEGGLCTSPKPRDNDPFDDSIQGHGTHVAGIIGAVTNNSQGVSGINWDVTLMAIKTMGKSGQGDLQDVVDGLKYAKNNGAKVINMSVDYPKNCSILQELQSLVDDAVSQGIVIVAAAGNGGEDNIGDDVSSSSPASCNGVIAVGAITQSDTRANSSNWGTKVDISAPGVSIYSTVPGNSYGTKNGTSMASPHVAGVVGLLLAVNPQLSVEQVRNCLVNNGDLITTDRLIGPRLNAFKTLNVCSGLASFSPTPTGIIPTATPPSTTLPPGSTLTPTRIPTPTPTPMQTYTCTERNDVKPAPPGTIKMGDLECIPN